MIPQASLEFFTNSICGRRGAVVLARDQLKAHMWPNEAWRVSTGRRLHWSLPPCFWRDFHWFTASFARSLGCWNWIAIVIASQLYPCSLPLVILISSWHCVYAPYYEWCQETKKVMYRDLGSSNRGGGRQSALHKFPENWFYTQPCFKLFFLIFSVHCCIQKT